jgi:hypothetical protein
VNNENRGNDEKIEHDPIQSQSESWNHLLQVMADPSNSK